MSDVTVSPLERLAALRDWIENGIGHCLQEDPSGLLAGIEAAAALDACDELADLLRALGIPAATTPQPEVPVNGQPRASCPDCNVECGVALVDARTPQERKMLVDLEPVPVDRDSRILIWVSLFSGHPPEGRLLTAGNLYRLHRCS